MKDLTVWKHLISYQAPLSKGLRGKKLFRLACLLGFTLLTAGDLVKQSSLDLLWLPRSCQWMIILAIRDICLRVSEWIFMESFVWCNVSNHILFQWYEDRLVVTSAPTSLIVIIITVKWTIIVEVKSLGCEISVNSEYCCWRLRWETAWQLLSLKRVVKHVIVGRWLDVQLLSILLLHVVHVLLEAWLAGAEARVFTHMRWPDKTGLEIFPTG